MKKSFALVIGVVFCLTSGIVQAAGKPKPEADKPATGTDAVKPTKETMLALADKYRKTCEPKLDFESKQTIDKINYQLASTRSLAIFHKQTIDALVNQLTMALAGLKKFDTLTVASAILVQTAPANPRTTNLFASVLHTSDKLNDSVTVFEYTLSLKRDSLLAMLNLANAYLDVNKDEKAKTLADQVVFKDSDNMAAHRVLATYWYRKNNLAIFRAELLKASKFKGYVRKKLDRKNQQVKDQSGTSDNSTEQLEQKARKLDAEVPLTTADIIEDEFPSQARRIRDKYGRLAGNEKMVMPRLPEVNMNTPADYRRNQPVIAEWAQLFEDRLQKYEKDEAARQGIDTNASEEIQRTQEEELEKRQAAEAIQQGLKMLESAKAMPGANQAELNGAIADLKREMQEQGIKPGSDTADAPATAINDSGSQLVLTNYGNYLRIFGTYAIYFAKYHAEYQPKVDNIIRVYNQKVEDNEKAFEPIWERLQEEHGREGDPHGKYDVPCRRAWMNHIKALNAISENYYKQWVNLYAPQYAQKMKPALDAFWNICMLYVRNMNDPKVMEREYHKVKRTYLAYALMAGSLIGGGDQFRYEGPTEEEEAQLQRDVVAADQEARQKKPQMEKDFQEPGTDWSKWIEDHLVVKVSGQFLSLKVAPTTIEFEAWAFGPGAGVKIDMVNEKVETYTSLGAKLKVGVSIGGVGLGIDAKADLARKVAKWDFENGTYEESYGGKSEAKAAFGPIAVGGEVEVDTELNAKVSGKIMVLDTIIVR